MVRLVVEVEDDSTDLLDPILGIWTLVGVGGSCICVGTDIVVSSVVVVGAVRLPEENGLAGISNTVDALHARISK